MSWQEEYVARYEAGLAEKWTADGYRIGCEVSYKDISKMAHFSPDVMPDEAYIRNIFKDQQG